MSQIIDVTTTAVLRPEVLETTFRSFRERLFKGHDVRLIMHVDLVGGDTSTMADVIKVAERYFGRFWVLPSQETPNQNLALKRVWEQVETDLFFNLEDDWELLVPLDLDDMIAIMRENPRLALLRTPRCAAGEDWCKVSPFFKSPNYFKWNGRYFVPPSENAMGAHFAGTPGLIRSTFMRPFLPLIRPEYNVERMLINMTRDGDPRCCDWGYGIYTYPNTSATVRECGLAWREAHGWTTDDRRNPTAWHRKEL